MVRKCANIAFGVALIVALSFAMAHSQPLKVRGASTDFSTPCEPASPALKAASESKVISTVDSILVEGGGAASDGVVSGSRVEAASYSIPRSAPLAYAPLLRRPPPVNS